METKKNKKVNIENQKSVFFQIGIIVSLAITLIAFEWSSKPKVNDGLQMVQQIEFENDMMITRREEPKQETKPEIPKVAEILDIVDDNIDIEDFDFDVEVNEDTKYDFTMIDEEDEIIEEDVPFIIVSNMPKFQGGDLNDFWAWCQEHAEYPEIAAENGVSGVVNIQFIINKQGYVDNVIIIRGVDPALDEEAIRVVKSSPRWTPGDQRGKPASVMMNMPIRFILQ